MNLLDLLKWGLGLALAGFVLRQNLWRAILFVEPSSIRIEPDEPADQMKPPEALMPLGRALLAAGFSPLGSHAEHPRFGRAIPCYDYVHPNHPVFATMYVGRGGGARVYLLSKLASGGFVLTANYNRPAREVPGRYLSGGLEGASIERLLTAHLRRSQGLSVDPARTLEARLSAARAWFAEDGRIEIRAQNLHGLLWTLGTVGMVAAAILRRG